MFESVYVASERAAYLCAYIEEENLNTRMLLQVHDELIFEVPKAEKDTVPAKLKDMMEQAWELSVPLKVEMGLAENWLKAH
jgi:DNA polymerase-1